MWIWITGIIGSLGLVGTIAAAIAFPGVVIPVLAKATAALLKCKPCMMLLAAIALLFAGSLYGVHVERQRGETRIEHERQRAEKARVDRDAEVKADLEKSFAPAMQALRALNSSLQDKVSLYEKRKPVAAPNAVATSCSCKLGDAAGLLQPAPAREPAGAAAGGITDYLRKHPGPGAGAGRSSGG